MTRWPGRTRNKYGARKVRLDGYTFDSRHEAEVYAVRKLEQEAGEIESLEVHRRFRIEVNGIHICDYEADLTYYRGGRLVVEDAKSPPTRKLASYRIKRKLMVAVYGIEVQEV